MNTFLATILVVLITFPLVFFVKRVLNGCPGRKKHDWGYVGTEIHETYNGTAKYKKYVCKNCGKIEYE